MTKESKIIDNASDKMKTLRKEFYELYLQNPIPENEVLVNLGLFIRSQSMSRILFMADLYKKQLDIHGNIIEFGVRWGQNLALFSSFRDIFEPYNSSRKIIGFDTFKGFPSIHPSDGKDKFSELGGYSVTNEYEDYLSKVLEYHESETPFPHGKRFELVKGDASVELKKYLTDNPETIISLAYFDFDLYEPTKKCLELILPHLVKGSVIGFDELNLHEFPGETKAVNEVLGLNKHKLFRSFHSGKAAYLIFE